MRRFVLLVPLAVSLTGCGGGSSTHVSAVGEAACAAAVVHDGTIYFGSRSRRPASPGPRLGEGSFPPCQDTNAPASPAQHVDVYGIRGVDSRLGVLVGRDRRTVYLEQGTFPQLPSHPLHRLFYASARQPDELDGRCNRRRTLSLDGVAQDSLFGAIPLKGRRDPIFVEARTRFRREARVHGGERLHIRALECRHAGDAHYRKLVALTVEPG